MKDIKPIQIEQTVITIQGWGCPCCDLSYPEEVLARSHRSSHCYTDSRWMCGTCLYRFETEEDFHYWKQHGPYLESGGCAGPWQGAGWYLIEWKGPEDNEYPSLELAAPTLKLKLENAKYEYTQALANTEAFSKLAH